MASCFVDGMRSLILVVTFILSLVEVADATPLFLASNDICQIDTSSDQFYWTTINGTPTVSTSVKDSETGNLCSLHFDPASTSTEYVARTISSASTLSACTRLYVTTAPATRRRLIDFHDTGADKEGAMLTLEKDATDTTKFRLKAFYDGLDISGGECASSRTQDGKECSTKNDCDYVNSGEQSCLPGVFASSTKLSLNTWYLACLKQVNGANGSATVTMWQGTAGSSPAVYQRGSRTRMQGDCTGGSVAGNACDVNADCTGGGTCDKSDIVTIEEVRFGTDDTGAGAMDYYLDDMVIDDGTPNPNYTIETSQPSAAGTTATWTGAYTDIDDGASPDDNTTRISKANETTCTGSTPNAVCTFDVNTTNPAAGTILAVGLIGLVQDTETGSSRTMGIRLDAWDGTTQANGTDLDEDSLSDQGNSAGYHQMAPAIFATKPTGGGNWDATAGNALQIRVERHDSTHPTNEVRVTSVAAEFLMDQTDPTLPTILPDRNGDGEDTLCIVGDSTFNDTPFQDEIVGGLLEPTNILECAHGGTTPGDMNESLSIAGTNNDIFDGATSQYQSCQALKGTERTPCDVVVIEMGVNALNSATTADPEGSTLEHGLSKPGYCDNKGGGNDTGACFCPHGTDHRQSNTSSSEAKRYCRTKGSDWMTECASASDCACSSNADCCADCPDSTCATCTTAQGVCSGGVCTCTGLGCLNCSADTTAASWSSPCVSGCLDSPQCPSGICMMHEKVIDVMNEVQQMEAKRVARPSPTAPLPTPPIGGYPTIIWSAPPPGAIKAGLGCWQDIEKSVGNYRTSLLKYARANSLPYIDMYGRFLRDCPGGAIGGTSCATDGCTYDGDSPTGTCTFTNGCCLRDRIHWNENYGQIIAAQAIIDALTHAGGVTHDGDCDVGVTNKCIAGRMNEPCTVDNECDTWSTPF